MDYERIYRETREQTKSEPRSVSKAVMACIRAGLDADAAADLSWRIEEGKPMPDFKHDHKATAEWNAGFENKNFPQD